MPFISSPVAYPPSSSPALPLEKIPKRPHLTKKEPGRKIGGFLLDDNDRDEDFTAAPHENTPDLSTIATVNDGQPPVNGELTTGRNGNHDSALLQILGKGIRSPQSSSPSESVRLRSVAALREQNRRRKSYTIKTCQGSSYEVGTASTGASVPFERLIASRSVTAPSRAQRSYYGVDIHRLMEETTNERKAKESRPPEPQHDETRLSKTPTNGSRCVMWTEKYRAKQFVDLVGDERTHRSVLRWMKGWEKIVFPQAAREKQMRKLHDPEEHQKAHRKILLLTGPPGLGKTTLAHVCARQAGYEVLEINASDDRSRDVVTGRIRDSLGTENVRGIDVKSSTGTTRRSGRPVCVVVDEVDGVTTGSGAGGEGGFVRALIDLVLLDQKNVAMSLAKTENNSRGRKKKDKDRFRLLRPLILICNDVYHPSLRPLRQSGLAEIVHVRKPPLSAVSSRIKTIFEREGLPCDSDAVRRLCEATWGVSSRKDGASFSSSAGEGDLRGVMVVAEWVASKALSALTSLKLSQAKITRPWVEEHILGDLADGGSGARGLGRGSVREITERVFKDGGGMTKPKGPAADSNAANDLGVAETGKKRAMDRLRIMVDTYGETDHVVADCFGSYPSQPFQDDTFLSKPNAAYAWLHFHDSMSSKVYSGQEWELAGYLSQAVLAFHHLFASPARQQWTAPSRYGNGKSGDVDQNEEEAPLPFTGPRADYEAREAEKENRSILGSLQGSLSVPLRRGFSSPEVIATDFVPHVMRMVSPNIKPVVVGGHDQSMASVKRDVERHMVRRAVSVMSDVGVMFHKGRIESDDIRGGNWVYRMEPPIDLLCAYATADEVASGQAASVPTRFAIRQLLDQEHSRDKLRQEAEARQARFKAGDVEGEDEIYGSKEKGAEETAAVPVVGKKRDFFGRVIVNDAVPSRQDSTDDKDNVGSRKRPRSQSKAHGDASTHEEQGNFYLTYHEGFSNAVRKPISLAELMDGL